MDWAAGALHHTAASLAQETGFCPVLAMRVSAEGAVDWAANRSTRSSTASTASAASRLCSAASGNQAENRRTTAIKMDPGQCACNK